MFLAGGQRVEVTDLIGRMHVATDRAQRHRQGVVIGGDRSAVAADEAHDRSALTLAGVETKVADDHPQVIQIPVQRFEVLGGLHDHVPSRCTRVGTRGGRWVVLARTTSWPKLNTCGCWAGSASSWWVPDTTRSASPLGSTSSTATPPRARAAGHASPQQIGLLGGDERRPDEPRARAAADQHARRAGVGAAQVQLVLGAQRGETERRGERLGPGKIRFSNSSQPTSWTLMTGLAERPGCSPAGRPARCAARCGRR